MSKRTPRSVKAACDKLFSLIIRSKGSCERCSMTDYSQLHCAHIYSRKFGSVRFDEDNALCLCARCHRWGHDNPTEFADFVNEKKNTSSLKIIKELLTKRKLADWLELESELKQKLNDN